MSVARAAANRALSRLIRDGLVSTDNERRERGLIVVPQADDYDAGHDPAGDLARSAG